MKQWLKKIMGVACAVLMLASVLGAVPVSAIEGGGLQNNSSSNVAYGCDLSFWNVGSNLDHSLVDFARMKADGCEFAILRIGYEGSSTHTDTLDKAFVQYYQNARAAGMDLGVYFYSLATTYAGAVQDAQWVISIIEQYDMYFEYPIYYDVEDSGQTSLGSSAMQSLCTGWCETLENAGYYPGIYGGMSQVITKLDSTFKATYDVWYPAVALNEWTGSSSNQYSPYTRNYSDRCSMWQYSWYDYEYDGIGLKMLDVNVAYKDYPAIIEGGGWNNTAVRHKISFETNGGSAIDPVYVTDGETLSEPTAPSRWGFEFGGWYCNPELTDVYDFSTPVPYDFTLYAKWDEAYWGANTDLMPKDGQLVPRSYNDAGEQLWPYWNASTGAVTMYSGVSEYAWPSAYMSYANSFDSSNDAYLYVKKDGNAQFNVELTYMDAQGNLHSIKASEILGLSTTDFPAGYWEGFINVGQYIYDQGHMTSSGNVKYTQVDYYVIGEKDQYVTLYECKLTPAFEIAASYTTLMNNVISAQTGTGSYVYDNGVLTMNSTADSGYSVTFDVNKTINPSDLAKLLVDINSTSDFNVSINATGVNGDCTINFNTEFFDRFGVENGAVPEMLPAGDWTVAMNLLGYFEWNGGAVTESTIQSVTVTMASAGTLTMSALQASRSETVEYVADGLYASGSTSGDAVDVPAKLTSSVYTVSDTIVSRIPAGTTLAVFLQNVDQTNVTVKNASGAAITDADVLATGMTVCMMNGTTVLKTYTVAVIGDTTGDGAATTVDARDILVNAVGVTELDEVLLATSDYNNDGVVNTSDVRELLMDI